MKKATFLFALFLCVLATQAQTFNNINMQNAEPRPDSEVAELVSSLENNSFPRQRLDILRKATNSSSLGFTGEQTVNILAAFDTSTEKGEAIKIMDELILGMNSENVIEAINTATFSSHKLAILDALRSTITDDDRRYVILDAFKTNVDKAKAKAILDRIQSPRSFIYGTVVSKQVVFVVDFSGSMEASFQLSNGNTVSRIDFVRNELRKAVSILPADTKINIIMFSTDIEEWKSRLTKADASGKSDALSFADRFSVQGATNIHGALRAAFADENVKTIYFLTDGIPTAGEVQGTDDIVNAVRSMNNRGVRVHTCAFLTGYFSGDNKPESKRLMKKIAEATRGVYRAFE